MENKCNLVEDESILDSIGESSTDDNSYGGSIITDDLEKFWDGNHVHPNINTRYNRLKMHDHIWRVQSKWKGA